jgi:hypothetical protein
MRVHGSSPGQQAPGVDADVFPVRPRRGDEVAEVPERVGAPLLGGVVRVGGARSPGSIRDGSGPVCPVRRP